MDYKETDWQPGERPCHACRADTAGGKHCPRYWVARCTEAYHYYDYIRCGVLLTFDPIRSKSNNASTWAWTNVPSLDPALGWVFLSKSYAQESPVWRMEMWAGFFNWLWGERIVDPLEPVPYSLAFPPPLNKGTIISQQWWVTASVELTGFNSISQAVAAFPCVDARMVTKPGGAPNPHDSCDFYECLPPE